MGQLEQQYLCQGFGTRGAAAAPVGGAGIISSVLCGRWLPAAALLRFEDYIDHGRGLGGRGQEKRGGGGASEDHEEGEEVGGGGGGRGGRGEREEG